MQNLAGCSKEFRFLPMCQEKPAEGLSAKMTQCHLPVVQHRACHTEGDQSKGVEHLNKQTWTSLPKDGKCRFYRRKRKISVLAHEKNKQFCLIQIHFHASLPKKHTEPLKSTGASWQNNFGDHYQMPLFGKAQKIVLAQSSIYEMTCCRNEGLRKLRLEARVMPLGRETGMVGEGTMPPSFLETWFPDL